MLINTHKQNQNASVTRVFIMSSFESVSEEEIKVMERQSNEGIKVLVAADVSIEDFTFVDDGEIIGITEEMKYGKRETRWIFRDDNQIAVHRQKKQIIENKSIPLATFRQQYFVAEK